MRNRVRAVGAAALFGATLFAPVASAAAPAGDAASLCRQLDEVGLLSQPDVDITRGECLNEVRGPATVQSNNVISGVCGLDFVLSATGTANKGECIEVVRDLF